jgi:hypothetical protein
LERPNTIDREGPDADSSGGGTIPESGTMAGGGGPPTRRPAWQWLAIGVGAAAIGGASWGAWTAATRGRDEASASAAARVEFDAAEVRPQVVTFCGGCHPFSEPENFPRDAWRREVKRGYDFYFTNNVDNVSLPVPNIDHVVTYYEHLAPERLKLPADIVSQESDKVRFRKEVIPLAEPRSGGAIAHVKLADVEWNGRRPTLLMCDMVTGELFGDSGPFAGLVPRKVAHEPFLNPAHIEPCDLDADGTTDFVVGDLGSPLSMDHYDGKVVWLRPRADGSLEPIVLAEGLGRVADVQPADFDKDGDPDLVVAEFGYIFTGGIRVLWHEGVKDGIPQFDNREIDPRHGAVAVPVVDLDGDGYLDFLASISQEFEVVEAFINQRDGSFSPERLFTAGNPSFASSDLVASDIDGDGDLDVLVSNGDTFDSPFAKPYQGLHWLENEGTYPFRAHQLACLPGAMRVRAGDLDGDGDMDVASVALLAPEVYVTQPETAAADSIVWMEQTEPGKFARRRIEGANANHGALDLLDIDADGDLDVLVSGLNYRGKGPEPALTLWRNLRIDAGP